MSTSTNVGKFHHVKTPALMKCCINCFAKTTTETNIDALSIHVRKKFVTRKKKMYIPPSPCCPFCWMLRPCMCCSFCYIQTTETTDQILYHKTAGRRNQVDTIPGTDFDNLFKIWFFGGLLGCHRFKLSHMRMGTLFIALWVLALFGGVITGLVNRIDFSRGGGSSGGWNGGGSWTGGGGSAGGSSAGGGSAGGGSADCELGRVKNPEPVGLTCVSCVEGQFSNTDSNKCESCPSGYKSSYYKSFCEVDNQKSGSGNQNPIYQFVDKNENSCSDVNGIPVSSSKAECAEKLKSQSYVKQDTTDCEGIDGTGKKVLVCSIICQPAKYAEPFSGMGRGSCQSCAAGQYQDKSGKAACKDCQGGTNPARDKQSCLAIGAADKQYINYFTKESGYCSDTEGGNVVTSKSECDQGAQRAGWSDTESSLFGSTAPYGCSFAKSASSTSRLQLNKEKPSGYSSECSSNYKCLCKRTCQPGTFYQSYGMNQACKTCDSANGNYEIRMNAYQDEEGKDGCKQCPSGQVPVQRLVIIVVVVVVVVVDIVTNLYFILLQIVKKPVMQPMRKCLFTWNVIVASVAIGQIQVLLTQQRVVLRHRIYYLN